jgi:hypothetical protein
MIMLAAPAFLTLLVLAQSPPAFAAEDLEFFEKRVRPVLVEHCYECHSAGSKQLEGGLLLDSREAVLKGGDTGPAAVSGDVNQSRLIEGIRYKSEELQMPPTGKLPDAEVAVLEEWVRRGLPFTPAEVTSNAGRRREIDIAQGRQHWAFRPVREHDLPFTSVASRLDGFIAVALQEQKLTQSGLADRRVLVRRASFDLLGLPPTADDVERFAADKTPDAYDRLIDRYLASPHYGERWGRYWLDLARYCDVAESWREGEASPWLYRDWVVSALNEDLPYDDFVRRQLAADLLPGAQPADNAALGFLGLSPTYWKELKLDHKVIKQVVAEEWEERIEAIGGTFLGLTVACARCHDHKFDPVTQHDYYALAGVLASVRQADRPIIPEELAAPALAARAKVKELQSQVEKIAKEKEPTDEQKAKLVELRSEIDQLKQTPCYDTPLAPGIAEASIVVAPDGEHRTKIEYRPHEAQDVAMHIRGNAGNPGPSVPRRFLAVLASDSSDRFDEGSGRRELAEAIVTDAAPLAARVMVNRVWQGHFGRGLVATPSNFGTTGRPPSHPELLDDLAARFIARGWSLKWLHRELMRSATYQQSSRRDDAQHARDPDNVWLWRMMPRQLDVEAWRDAMLAASGELDLTFGGPAIDLDKPENRRRTLYGEVKRRELSSLLRLFDFPDPTGHSAARITTTTPLQQLFTLNGPLLQAQCQRLAERVQREAPEDDDERVKWLYRTVYARPAAEEEVAAAVDYLTSCRQDGMPADVAWKQFCYALLAGNELLFVE